MGNLSYFGPVSADQEMQPGQAITLSETLTFIESKDRVKGEINPLLHSVYFTLL